MEIDPQQNKTPAKEMSYDEAVGELETILAELERSNLSVDQLAAQVARGSELIEHCKARLDSIEKDVETAVAKLDQPSKSEEQ